MANNTPSFFLEIKSRALFIPEFSFISGTPLLEIIKSSTVLSLFEDVEYDLNTVRYKKTVKPIYFTQFPRDLDALQSTKLKKETFIKIVLPLILDENNKTILNNIVKTNNFPNLLER